MNKTQLSIKQITSTQSKGYFKIGIFQPQHNVNIGSLIRTAFCMGANEVFIIGKKNYKKAATDTVKGWAKIPFVQYGDFEDFRNTMPFNCQLVGIELSENSVCLSTFKHPKRAIYLLGSEGCGIPEQYLEQCVHVVQIPSLHCLNVSVTGGIILSHRINQLLNE